MAHNGSSLFRGCASALITPFTQDGAVDIPALITLINRQSNMDAIVLLGTTGEPCALSMQEREQIISAAVNHSRIPVIVGTGSNDTRKAIEFAKQAEQLGAAGQLAVTPYYNKTTQNGLIRHYSAILDCCSLPMILYNVPSRTGLNMSVETIMQLAVDPRIVGIKEASGNLSLTADILTATDGKFPVYCGNDELILPMLAMGAVGAISVCSNIMPMQVRAIIKACESGCLAQAQAAQCALIPLMKILSAQINPIPVKAALAMMGFISETLRLPLVQLENPWRSELYQILTSHGLV